MININVYINNYTLYGILIIAILGFVAFMYYIKRKFDSIDEYNKLVSDKLNSYKENQKQYNKNQTDSGIKSKRQKGITSKIVKIVNIIRGSE